MSVYTGSLPSGDPHTTKIGLSVVAAAATRSLASGLLIVAKAPVIGQMIMSTLGSSIIACRIFGPRSSADGAPPLSTGLDTRK
jgi:hypothetical protein